MVVIWGLNFTISKVALAQISPLAFNALRFPMAAALLALVLAQRGELHLPARHELPRVILVGLLGNALYQVFFILGLDHTSAGNAALLLAGTPIITALLSAALGHERLRWSTWIGVSFTFLGITLIVFGSGKGMHGSLLGNLLMLGASITWACYTVGSRPLIDHYGSVRVTAWTLWIGTIGIVLCGIPDVLHIRWSGITPGTWAALLYAGVLSIGLAYMIWYYGVAQLGNTRTSIYSNITPIVAVIGAWIFMGEKPHALEIVGAAVIITGVTIAQGVSARALPEG